MLVVLLLLATCRDRAAEPARGPSIELALDGVASQVSIDRAVPLAALVGAPPASWLEVHAGSRDDRGFELETPSETYPGAEVLLYLERGQIAIGVFTPVTADMSPEVAALARQPLAALGGLARVDVLTRRELGLSPLLIERAGRTFPLTGEQLQGLPARAGRKSRPQGWSLADVIALAVPGDASGRVHVIGAGELVLDGAALHDPGQIHVLKANQRGEYVLRVWREGGRQPTREVRAVTKIVLD